MNGQQRFARDDGFVRRYEYDDQYVLVTDVGPETDASVDVVDGTAILVLDEHQYEFEVPDGEAQAFMKNGVVTVEVER